MNEIYSKVFIARFKRSSARPIGCPVAFRIEASALGLDLNVPHTFVRALRLELVGRHTQNFCGVTAVQVRFRIGQEAGFSEPSPNESCHAPPRRSAERRARRDGAQQRKGWGGRDTLQGSWRVVLGCKPGSSGQLTACCCQALVHWSTMIQKNRLYIKTIISGRSFLGPSTFSSSL